MLIAKKISFLSYMPGGAAAFWRSGPNRSVTGSESIRYGWRISTIFVLLVFWGCGSSDPERAEDYLIRLGKLEVSRQEFLQAFELVKTAYPGSVDADSPELQQARLKLLDEMTIDLILRQRARERGIAVSPAELEAAVDGVKADYPPGVFEQTLVEAALPFHAWKQRLHSRLLMEKLVDIELRPHVRISAEDIAAYYKRNYGGKAAAAESEQKFEHLKETLVADLRRAKTEEAFHAWIDGLRSKYPVEVNAALWARITAPGQQAASPPNDGGEPGK